MEPWAIYGFKQKSFWYIYDFLLPTIFLILLVFSGVGKNLIYECLVYFDCIFMHSYLVNGFWTQACLDKRIDFYLYSLSRVGVLNDIEGVRIPCLCILYSNAKILIYARTLGSFLILFRALFLSYHDIFFCPIGFSDLLIACFIH